MSSIEHRLPINEASTDHYLPHWHKTIQKLKLQKRVCQRFVSQEINEQLCICNNLGHKRDVTESNGVWNWKTDTKKEPTECYGLHPDLHKPYLRCDIQTDPEQLCLVLLGIWCMPMPGLIMRVIGDAASTFHFKLEKELLQGISDAAVASDAWILTSGYKEDAIAELIGEIVYKKQLKNAKINFSAIAVGKWGNTSNRSKLDKKDTEGDRSGRFTLEQNHTHYIFFDDGTHDSIDTGGFTSRLARHISNKAGRRIPLVSILVGGNLHALKSIWNDLRSAVPVVIVDQSGPLANILCKYYKRTKRD